MSVGRIMPGACHLVPLALQPVLSWRRTANASITAGDRIFWHDVEIPSTGVSSTDHTKRPRGQSLDSLVSADSWCLNSSRTLHGNLRHAALAFRFNRLVHRVSSLADDHDA